MRISDWSSDVCSSDLTVPSRLAIYLRQCCTEGQDAIIARQVETAHRFRVTDHSMMRIMEEQGHSSAPLAKSTKSGNDGGIGPFVHDDQIRILYHLLRVETGGVIAAGGKLRIGIAESRQPSLAVVSHQIGKAPDRKSTRLNSIQ